MSGPEATFWRSVSLNLSPFGKMVRVENGAGAGTPDVAYVLTRPKPGSLPASGWIELKQLDDYPTKPMTPIVLKHLTLEQVLFAEDWSAAGGRAWMLLKATPWILLFDVVGIRGVYEKNVAAADGPAIARVAGFGKFPTGALLKALTQ